MLLPAAALAVIGAGAAAYAWPGGARAAYWIWWAGLVVVGAPVVWRTLRGMWRGHFASDVVAMLAIVGAVLLAQPLAGLVVVLMQTGGEALERYAEGRASRAIRELEAAAPRRAHRLGDGTVADITVEEIAVGDLLLVRPGELVPCDGVVTDGHSLVDASRLTGEPVPVQAEAGVSLMSGSVNGDGALTMRATALAVESQYARIVELVRHAQESKSPLQRLADRYAVWFTPVTLIVCAAAYLTTGDWVRVLAVLVVATPCPLILATPIAIIGGINAAARRMVIVRNGAALEQLSRVDTAVFDKTGTLTVGTPEVRGVIPAPGFDGDEVLRLAGAVEQGSGHLLARTIVRAAESRFGTLPPARHHRESPGRGLSGDVDGREVAVGARSYILELPGVSVNELAALEHGGDGLRAYVAVDGRLAGIVDYADRIRPNIAGVFSDLGSLGVPRTLLLSGDHTPNARAVAAAVGISEVHGDLLPEDKVAVVNRLRHEGARVLMVGDGTNDAPALTAADVGIALAGHGGGITAEAADVVILVDEPERVVEAVRIGRRTMRVARQSIWVGLGLSAIAMGFAARGYIVPTVGAVLQEAIDVAVILNALRTSGGRAS
ncbi:MAG: cadmium-translocating P-type ATPase [Gemmatimonadota bacterium]|nr:cadmium-translocating P-type ATPase [Gemmatimonadota bacterium]